MSTGIDKQLPQDLWSLPFINRGISGIVFAVDELSVIKTPAGGENNCQELEIERKILERLGEHPRIVKLLRIDRDMIILERLQYPLRVRIQELQNIKAKPTVKEILKWSAQAAEGMQYLHSKSVFQVDIGPHNLLLDWDDNIKYCDFSGSSLDGRAALVSASLYAQHPSFSVNSPSVQSEIFSLGCTIFEISTTHRVYEGKGETEVQNLFAKGHYPKTEDLLLGSTILNCWTDRYQDAGQVAADIREIQRRILLGDLSLSLYDLVQHRRNQQCREGKLFLVTRSLLSTIYTKVF